MEEQTTSMHHVLKALSYFETPIGLSRRWALGPQTKTESRYFDAIIFSGVSSGQLESCGRLCYLGWLHLLNDILSYIRVRGGKKLEFSSMTFAIADELLCAVDRPLTKPYQKQFHNKDTSSEVGTSFAPHHVTP